MMNKQTDSMGIGAMLSVYLLKTKGFSALAKPAVYKSLYPGAYPCQSVPAPSL